MEVGKMELSGEEMLRVMGVNGLFVRYLWRMKDGKEVRGILYEVEDGKMCILDCSKLKGGLWN